MPSHRWEDDEITFSDFRKGRKKGSQGYEKVMQLCEATRRYNTWFEHPTNNFRYSPKPDTDPSPILQHVWIDTCCIDKRSSADLSEAINSMYDWYSRASICFAYISDLQCVRDETMQIGLEKFIESAWFTRGWTLQEMLAPPRIVFCDAKWTFVYHKCDGGDCH